ncbi:MAG: phosphomannose isomerase type II C-terminal cupin domain [Tagaea sp.]
MRAIHRAPGSVPINRYKAGQSGKRPWGRWRVVDVGAGFAVKRIEVAPGHRLSLQRHEGREERWVIVAGSAVVTLGARTRRLGPGGTVRIPKRAIHRLENDGDAPLILIEIQYGARLDEADIERLADDYART